MYGAVSRWVILDFKFYRDLLSYGLASAEVVVRRLERRLIVLDYCTCKVSRISVSDLIISDNHLIKSDILPKTGKNEHSTAPAFQRKVGAVDYVVSFIA